MEISLKTELKHGAKRKKKAKSGGFESLNLSPNIFRGIKRKGYTLPTPIQRKTMPLILKGADVVAMARTGSGKSAAFIVPMLERLKEHIPQGGIRALILSPTRDLALQTLKFTKELGRYTDLRMSLLVGGDSMERQFEELAQNPDIVIATPGRLMHHLAEVDDLTLRTVEYMVFDEADSLFGMGFAEQLHKILFHLSATRQTLLFSATLPGALAEFAKAGLRDPQLVRLDLEARISPDLKLVFFTLRQEEKIAALMYLIQEHINTDQQTLIFVATKHHVEFLNTLFREEGIYPSICYGDMDQEARRIHISKFRARKTMLLIVTDVAARGIDIPLLENVINWDFPPRPKIFVHRVGRAARAGRTGAAFSFLTSEDMPYLLDLHLYLSKLVMPAPTENEIVQDVEKAMAKIDQAMVNGETVYGKLPQNILDLVSDRIQRIIASCTDLHSLQKTCFNAFRIYSKTKPPPSRASICRAKKLPWEGLHPLFSKDLGSKELTALAFSKCLQAYRSKQTILEVKGETVTQKHSQGAHTRGLDVMRKKRSVHEEIINLEHQKCFQENRAKEDARSGNIMEVDGKAENFCHKRKLINFRDEEYYISSVPTNMHLEAGLSIKSDKDVVSNRLEAAVLDLLADDSAGMQKTKSIYHWDQRKKKYIKLNDSERVTASGKIRNEGGKKVKAQKLGIYKRWKERLHVGVPCEAMSTSDQGRSSASEGKDWRNNMGRKFIGERRSRAVINKNVSSELKDLEQVRKERQKKTARISFMKSRTSTNKQKKRGKAKNVGGRKQQARK